MVVVVAAGHAGSVRRAAVDPIAGISAADSVANTGEAAAVAEHRIARSDIRSDQRSSNGFPGAIVSCGGLRCRICTGARTRVEDSTAPVGYRRTNPDYCGSRGGTGLTSIRSIDRILPARNLYESKSFCRSPGVGLA